MKVILIKSEIEEKLETLIEIHVQKRPQREFTRQLNWCDDQCIIANHKHTPPSVVSVHRPC